VPNVDDSEDLTHGGDRTQDIPCQVDPNHGRASPRLDQKRTEGEETRCVGHFA
jgi:hypothetical protein